MKKLLYSMCFAILLFLTGFSSTIGAADAHGCYNMGSGNCNGSGQVYNQGGYHHGEGYGAGYGKHHTNYEDSDTQVSNNQAAMMNRTLSNVESSNVNSTFSPLRGPCFSICQQSTQQNSSTQSAFSYNCIRMNNINYPN